MLISVFDRIVYKQVSFVLYITTNELIEKQREMIKRHGLFDNPLTDNSDLLLMSRQSSHLIINCKSSRHLSMIFPWKILIHLLLQKFLNFIDYSYAMMLRKNNNNHNHFIISHSYHNLCQIERLHNLLFTNCIHYTASTIYTSTILRLFVILII